MSTPLVLASCFLPLDASHCRWWLKFQDALAQQGMELMLLSHAPAVEPQLRVITLPLWLQGYGLAFGSSPTPLTLEEPLAQALAERDRSWSGQEPRSLTEFQVGLGTCQHVLRTLLAELQPAVVLVWGSSLPQSVVLQQLALQQGRPCWVLERGFIPDTLMLEMSGQGGQSEWHGSFALQRALRDTQATDAFRTARQIHRTRQSSKNPTTGEPLTSEELRHRFCPPQRRLVSALLQHDGASALSPASFLGARQHATGIPSAFEAARHLAAAAAPRSDCQLLLRPHPLDLTDYAALESDQVRVVREGSLHAVLQASDVVACMTSTCQFEALLYEKPLLLLANSALAGKGVAYEAMSPAEVAPALAAALAFDGFAERLERGRRFLSFALENFLIALSDDLPTSPGLGDLAGFLARHALRPSGLASVEERFLGVRSWFALWAKAKAEMSNPSDTPPSDCGTPSPSSTSVGPSTTATDSPTSHATHRMNCHSHIGQDAWAAECLRFRRNGFFLDFGAFDGTSISNTLALERDLGWRGICVEPNPRYYPALCASRRCITVNAALWHESRRQLEFIDAHGLSSIADFKDTDLNSQRRQDATRSIIRVDTLNPNELLERFEAPGLIDFLSLDVEGAEYDILTAIDLRRYRIALMAIEHNHNQEHQKRLRDYLAGFGYEVVQNRNDDFFFHRAHLAELLADAPEVPDPLAVFERIYAVFPISATGPDAHPFPYGPALASTPAVTAPVAATESASGRRRPTPAAPISPASLRQSADDAFARQAWTEANSLYQKLTQATPDELELWQRRIQCAREAGHEVLADLVLEEALERHPEWTGTLRPDDGSAPPGGDDLTVADTEVVLGVEGRHYGF